MPKIGDTRKITRLACHLRPGSIITSKLLDEKKGKTRRVTDVLVRTGLVRFRTVDHAPAKITDGLSLEMQRKLRDQADSGCEWFELPREMVVA